MASEQPVPRFFLLLIVVAALLLALVIFPVISELLLAAVLAGVLWPLQQWLTQALRGRRGIAAGVLTVAVIVLLLGPVATIATFVIRDGSDGVRFVSDALRSEDVQELVDLLPDAPRGRGQRCDRQAADATWASIMGQVAPEGRRRRPPRRSAKAVVATGSFVFHAVLMLIALFFLLVRGDELVDVARQLSPLGRGQTQELLLDVQEGLVRGHRVGGGHLGGAGGRGAGRLLSRRCRARSSSRWSRSSSRSCRRSARRSVCLVAAALLLVTGHPYMAIFLAAWGVVVVGLVDNLVKPLLIKRGLEIHGAIVFFSLIGGLAAFGAIGLLLGPLVVALFLALLRIYQRDYTPGDPRVAPVPGVEEGDPPERPRG